MYFASAFVIGQVFALDQLAAHLTSVERPKVPRDEKRGLAKFRRHVLPRFINL